jgi:hypothetical protein
LEVTVNIFSLYVNEVLYNRVPGHDGLKPESRKQIMDRFFAQPLFEQWKRDHLLALIMYAQLSEGFGWDAYRRVFAEYLDLPDHQRPQNDDQKRDQWMVRFSRTVGHNLGPFFQLWRIPVSDQALASIRDLPVWIPDEMHPYMAP